MQSNSELAHILLRGAQTLVYSEENRLSALWGGGADISFGYAEGGARLWKYDWNTDRTTVYVGSLYEERAGQRLCHVYAGGRRIATFEPQSTVCQALGLPAKWDGRLERLGRALTWPLRHGYQPAVLLALTLLGVLALVVGPAACRVVGRAAPRAPHRVRLSRLSFAWAWLTRFLPTYHRPRRPSPYEAPLVLATARSWWQRAVAAVTMAALVMAQTPARAESSLPAGCFYYYLADHLGSSNVVTYRDGLVAQHFENGVFGREVYEQHGSTHQLSARYTGQIFDEETGLYYYGARYYDPELGRFTQADTLVPDPGDGQSLNRYSYANNNPLKYTDPSGHEPVTAILIGIAVGAALGAATTAATGGNVGMGILTGAIGGLFGGLGSALAPFGSAFAGAVSGSALGGAVNSAVTGGNVGLGALSGAIAGAIGFGAAKLQLSLWGAATPQDWVDDLTGFATSAGAGALGGGIGAELQGGDFGEGALGGGIAGAIGFLGQRLLFAERLYTAAHEVVTGGKANVYVEYQDKTKAHLVFDDATQFVLWLNKTTEHGSITRFRYVGHGNPGSLVFSGDELVLNTGNNRLVLAINNGAKQIDITSVFQSRFSPNAEIRLCGCEMASGSSSIAHTFKALFPEGRVFGYTGNSYRVPFTSGTMPKLWGFSRFKEIK